MRSTASALLDRGPTLYLLSPLLPKSKLATPKGPGAKGLKDGTPFWLWATSPKKRKMGFIFLVTFSNLPFSWNQNPQPKSLFLNCSFCMLKQISRLNFFITLLANLLANLLRQPCFLWTNFSSMPNPSAWETHRVNALVLDRVLQTATLDDSDERLLQINLDT